MSGGAIALSILEIVCPFGEGAANFKAMREETLRIARNNARSRTAQRNSKVSKGDDAAASGRRRFCVLRRTLSAAFRRSASGS
jgi:hypothetical protein